MGKKKKQAPITMEPGTVLDLRKKKVKKTAHKNKETMLAKLDETIICVANAILKMDSTRNMEINPALVNALAELASARARIAIFEPKLSCDDIKEMKAKFQSNLEKLSKSKRESFSE